MTQFIEHPPDYDSDKEQNYQQYGRCSYYSNDTRNCEEMLEEMLAEDLTEIMVMLMIGLVVPNVIYSGTVSGYQWLKEGFQEKQPDKELS